MLSLYINIPFCEQKCKYCNFFVIPTNNLSTKDQIIEKYVQNLLGEIDYRKNNIGKKEIKTIYFGGGTPASIGADNIIKIIESIKENFNIENLVELSIELNPYPYQETYDFIDTINKKYNNLTRIRFSIGIQTFDSELLEVTGRQYHFQGVVEFLRGLTKIKQENNLFNFDFIAFGKFNTTKKGNKLLRDDVRLNFFEKFVNSFFADSFSLYTLELFPGSERFQSSTCQHAKTPNNTGIGEFSKYNITEDTIYEEFEMLKEILQEAGYQRYEISNFAFIGKSSIHNRVYREMEDYLGLGVSASSMMKVGNNGELKIENGKLRKKVAQGTMNNEQCDGKKSCKETTKVQDSVNNNSTFNTQHSTFPYTRWTNTTSLIEYEKGNYVDESTVKHMGEKDYWIEKFFLGLRTDQGIKDISQFKSVLVKDFETKLDSYQKQGFVIFDGKDLKLTDQGMDVYNSLITELLLEI